MQLLQRSDITKFVIYTGFFFLVFSGYNVVHSPVYEMSYNSANINQGEKIESVKTREIPVIKKPQKKAILSLSFRPEYVSLDEKTVEIVKKNVYSEHFKNKVTPLSMIIDSKMEEPRGQVSGNTLILSSKISDNSELLKVFVHELWHIVDVYFFKRDALGDISDKFYAISWDRYDLKKKTSKTEDFVSGYALSNGYEDFAESFTFYIFHNEEFIRRAQKNPALKDKYLFIQKYVFDDASFIKTSFEKETIKKYNWDTTKIGVNVKKYLYYIE